jgi:membrane protein
MWVAGSVLLRFVLSASIGSTSIYGPLAAPIATLIWLYVISIAILIGAACNSSIDELFPKISGLHPDAPNNEADPPKPGMLRRTLAHVRTRPRRKSQ